MALRIGSAMVHVIALKIAAGTDFNQSQCCDILRRDARDGGRDAAPMKPASDANLLDTTELTIEQSTDAARRIVEAARSRWETAKG